jgi:hypothetical protein
MVNLDFNLAKDFKLTERVGLQFRSEFFNALNHTNFGVPGVTVGAGFGQIVSRVGGPWRKFLARQLGLELR